LKQFTRLKSSAVISLLQGFSHVLSKALRHLENQLLNSAGLMAWRDDIFAIAGGVSTMRHDASVFE
jgi:hypothetical protein